MHYLKLTIQRNRRRIQLEELLLLLLRIALPVLLFFFLARPVLNPTGLEQWLGTGGRSSQVVLIDDSLSMGYGVGEAAAFAAGPAGGRGTAGLGPAPGSLHGRDQLGTEVPVVHDVEGTRRDELSAAVASVPLSATHAAWPAVLEGGRRGFAVVHLSHPPAHDRDRPAEERLGARGRIDQPAVERRRGPRAGRRCGQRRDDQRLASGAAADRSHDAGRHAKRLGGGDSQRLAPHADRGQGHSCASMTSRPRWPCRRLRRIRPRGFPWRFLSRVPAPMSFRSRFPTTSCPATTGAGLPSRSRTRC